MDKSIKLLSAAVALALLAPSASYATNGYFMIGAGAKTRGMGGAGIAYGQDSLAAAANPATAIDVGSRVDIGAEIFRPIRAVKHNSGLLPADEQSQRNLFSIMIKRKKSTQPENWQPVQVITIFTASTVAPPKKSAST